MGCARDVEALGRSAPLREREITPSTAVQLRVEMPKTWAFPVLACPPLSSYMYAVRLPYGVTWGDADGTDASRWKAGYPCSALAAQKAAGALLALDLGRAGSRLS